MADSYTKNYNMTKPEVGASRDTWGTKYNANMDTLDTAMKAVDDRSVALKTEVDGKIKTVDDRSVALKTEVDGKIKTALADVDTKNAATLNSVDTKNKNTLTAVDNKVAAFAFTTWINIEKGESAIASAGRAYFARTGAYGLYLPVSPTEGARVGLVKYDDSPYYDDNGPTLLLFKVFLSSKLFYGSTDAIEIKRACSIVFEYRNGEWILAP